MQIPFCKAHLGKEEQAAVQQVIESGWLTQGAKVKEFEEAFAAYVGAKHAVAVNSCTAALFLVLRYYDEKIDISTRNVLVPSLTFTASAAVVVHNNFNIVWGEVDHELFCLHPVIVDYILKTDNIPIAISVHLTGNRAPTKFSHPVIVIEDSAHRIERNMQGDNPICYSFYATKNMTTGEGGMITTNNEELAAWLRMARLHGSDKDGFKRYANKGSWEYSIKFCGWKMNMTDVAAAIGIEQLKKLDGMNRERQRIVDRYNKALGLSRTGLHLYPIRVNDRPRFMEYMTEQGIHCSVHFLPLHKMPAYSRFPGNLPVTETLGAQFVSLPLYPDLTDHEVDYVVKAVQQSELLIAK